MPTSEFADTFARLAANHLWQSTAFAAIAALLALALRGNHARVRHGLWLAASVKFLVPFAALAAVGGRLGQWFVPAAAVSRVPFVVEQIVQPFASVQEAPSLISTPAPAAPNLFPAVLLALWLCGFAAVLIYGWVRWRRVAAAVRAARPLTEGRELEVWDSVCKKAGQEARPTEARRWFGWGGPPGLPSVISSSAELEPGVFGIFRPVLWLPAGIGDRLDDAELEAILAHELCHIRRRDNLTAALHMAVEAIFWFHPLVWWLGARLTEERERACDEEVVRMGGEPQIYAESILKVCEFYLASPVACAAGVTGGELKKRIEGIMTNRFIRELGFGKRVLLTLLAAAAVGAPMVVGVIHPPRLRAQPGPAFEVASVKPASSRAPGIGCSGGPGTTDPGTWNCSNVSLEFLFANAYGLQRYQFTPLDWMNDARFDIAAKVPAGTTREQFQRMQQNLLTDRFKLTLHHEQKEMPIYELTAAEKGPKMKESAPGAAPAREDPWAVPKFSLGNDGYPEFPAGRGGLAGLNGHFRWTGFGVSMEEIARTLSGQLGRPVVDTTGLKGRYDIDLTWVIDMSSVQAMLAARGMPPVPEADSGPTLLRAVQDRLGLKLNSTRGPGDVVVVDHAEKAPTEN